LQFDIKLATYLLSQNAMEVAPATGANVVGQTTGQSVYRSRWIKIKPAAIVGQAFSYYGTVAYGAAVTANPTALLWAGFVATSFAAATNLTNGVLVTFTLQLTTRFYSNNVVEALKIPVVVNQPMEIDTDIVAELPQTTVINYSGGDVGCVRRDRNIEILELRKRLACLELDC
jgi:hypothetical protein